MKYTVLTATEVLETYGYIDKLKQITGDYYDDVLSGMINNLFPYCNVIECEENDKLFNLHKLAYSMYNFILDENDFYNDEKQLLNDVTIGTTKQVNKFNDTPQNNGTYDDDRHTSTISINETSGTADTMYRLKLLTKLRDKYINHFRDAFEIM